MKMLRLSGLAMLTVFVAACVTINIYFPAAQAEQAAEAIVKEIMGAPAAPKPEAAPAGEKDKGAAVGRPGVFLRIASATLDVLVAPAWAGAPDFNIDTAEIRRLRAQMKARHPQMAPLYDTGAVGFTRSALVALRDPQAVPLKQRNQAKTLVDEENADRQGLYRAIAVANGHPEWEGQVRDTFATQWIQQARSGWWYQNGAGVWVHK